MTRLRPARRAAVLSATGLLLALSLVPGVPASAAAASDGLEVTTDATYTFLPAKAGNPDAPAVIPVRLVTRPSTRR